jgi:L-ascorbate metabolism protein UlaG (beta-lactamase superfamily)
MKITYFGHSAFQIDTNEYSLLIDPFIDQNPMAQGVVSAGELNPDYILLTHAHGDHWGDTPEIAARSGATVVGCFEISQYLANKVGYANSVGTNTGGCVAFEWGKVTYTHARHSSSFPDGTYGGVACGLLLEIEGKLVYHAGDTEPFAEMSWISSGRTINVAMLPIGDCFTMGPETSLKAVDLLKPESVIPIHYNTFPPIELTDEQLARWERRVVELGATANIMSPGASVVV